MEKYKIEKDSVQETLIIPLYGRRLCSQRFPGLYQDSTAAMLMEKVATPRRMRAATSSPVL